MKKIILAALCGFSFAVTAADLNCHNPNERTQVCIGANGYVVTCTKTGNIVTCVGQDGTTHTFIES